jgi:glycosyltransferase involved in cell wall biosynthesis
MRVCHVSPHLPPDQAANALLPAQLGAWSARRGIEVSFVTQPPTQGRPSSDALAGPVWRTRPRSSSAILRLLRIDTLRRARSISAALDTAAGSADVLHLHSNGLIIEVAAEWARRRRIPYLLTLYGTEIWHYRPRRGLDPFTRAYRGAAEVTFYSQRLLDKARECGLDRDRLTVVYPAVHETFKPVDAATREARKEELGIKEPLVVLNVKRLHELAGQKFLIDAFARVARRRADVRLVICGTGPLRAALEAQARECGIAERVTFTGLLSNDRIARFAALSDVFALPSLLEALPTVAVEALAAGTPVVSADHPGGVELHGLFGADVEVVPRQDVDRLAAAIDTLLASPRRVSAATRAEVGRLFSPAAVDAAYQAVYDRVMRPAIL